MSQNTLRILEISGLAILSLLQHSSKSSHISSVIPIALAFSGLEGRKPEMTAWRISVSLMGKKGHLPVKTWYTVIPIAYASASLDGTPLSRSNILGRRSSGAMKYIVPSPSSLDTITEMVVTRVNARSARMALGGAESEMRIFVWDGVSSQFGLTRELVYLPA